MGRKKKENPMMRITICISKEMKEHLKRLCIDMAYRDKKEYHLSTLIQETLAQAYPPPKTKQMEMFK